MVAPLALVIRTAGTNCDRETVFALEHAGARCEIRHINYLAEEKAPFADAQMLVLPGGFTYGDDVASGKILAMEIAHTLGEKIPAFIARGGLVLGICNGFQALVKTGLLPDAKLLSAESRTATLTFNDSRRFECRWVRLKADKNTVCVFAEPGEEIEIPVAHGEGKLVAREPSIVDEWQRRGQIVYRYAAADNSEPAYPADPNGSLAHIAGLCDPTGRIFGLMPHPERHLFAHQHPHWTRGAAAANGAGTRIFARAVACLRHA